MGACHDLRMPLLTYSDVSLGSSACFRSLDVLSRASARAFGSLYAHNLRVVSPKLDASPSHKHNLPRRPYPCNEYIQTLTGWQKCDLFRYRGCTANTFRAYITESLLFTIVERKPSSSSRSRLHVCNQLKNNVLPQCLDATKRNV